MIKSQIQILPNPKQIPNPKSQSLSADLNFGSIGGLDLGFCSIYSLT